MRKADLHAKTALSLVDHVYTRTRNAILQGDYAPGSPLRLERLAAENRVSLIPVREALRLLEAERLVESTPNKGARVAPLSLPDVIDAYQTRIALEIEALRRANAHIDTGVIVEARAQKDLMVDHFKRGNDEAAFAAHRSLHFALYGQANSEWLLYIIRILWDHTERYRRLAKPLYRSFDEIGEEHERVLRAIEKRDLRGAAKALKAHLTHTSRLLIEAFQATAELADS